jgi:acyl carrier protein
MDDQKPACRDDVIVQLRADLCCIQPRLPSTWPDSLLFQADLGLDSLDLFELVARLEQRYQILIDDTELPGFVSLEAMADFVCAHTQS